MRWMLAVLAGCSAPVEVPDEPGTITLTNTVTVTNVVTVTVHVTPPCRVDTPGWICVWAGVPGLMQFAPDGLPRKKSALNLPTDVAFDPTDGRPYIADWNNNRIRTVLVDDTIVTAAGSGGWGVGVWDPQTGTWGDGPALDYTFQFPTRIAFDPLDPGASTSPRGRARASSGSPTAW